MHACISLVTCAWNLSGIMAGVTVCEWVSGVKCWLVLITQMTTRHRHEEIKVLYHYQYDCDTLPHPSLNSTSQY